jgi:hypothetical protein
MMTHPRIRMTARHVMACRGRRSVPPFVLGREFSRSSAIPRRPVVACRRFQALAVVWFVGSAPLGGTHPKRGVHVTLLLSEWHGVREPINVPHSVGATWCIVPWNLSLACWAQTRCLLVGAG